MSMKVSTYLYRVHSIFLYEPRNLNKIYNFLPNHPVSVTILNIA
jgi:hypothetical protein